MRLATQPLLGLLLSVATVTPLTVISASAQSGESAKPPTAAEEKKGSALYKQGKIAEKNGQCSEAVSDYIDAYALLRNDKILFDIATCQQTLGNIGEALHYFLLTETRIPESKLEGFALDQVTSMETADPKKIYQLYLDYLANDTAVTPETRPHEYRELAEKRKEALETAHPEWAVKPVVVPTQDPNTSPNLESQEKPQPKPPTKNPGSGKRIVGLSLLGLGVVSLGVSGYYVYDSYEANKDQDDYLEENGVLSDDIDARGKRAEKRAIIAGGAAAGLIVTGGIFYWMGRKQGKGPTTQISVITSGEFTGAFVRGSF